jgi:chromosome segregation ATPase
MPDDKEKQPAKNDQDKVVDDMLSELGVDDAMRQELVESGRMSSDVVKVATAEQIRRQMEIEKSRERLRENLNIVERDMMKIENFIDRVEGDLVPVVLSFLVRLKGDLVGLKTDIIGRSKRRAKTNLQANFVETTVKSICDEEFSDIEETLTSGMSAPILEKIRELTDTFKKSVRILNEEYSHLKASIDVFGQRAGTEIEFLSKEVSMKPKVEVPKDVKEKIEEQERQLRRLRNEVELLNDKLENREAEITALQTNLAATKARNENLENAIRKAKEGPAVDTEMVAGLRKNVKALETEKELLEDEVAQLSGAQKQSEEIIAQLKDKITKTELSERELQNQLSSVQSELEKASERFSEIDELRSIVRDYESGDVMREAERLKSELDREQSRNQRLIIELEKAQNEAETTAARLNGYLDLMASSEKTKAFLMVEDNKEMEIREIARSLGVSPAIVSQWANDFVDMGLAHIKDGKTLVLADELVDESG